MNELEHQKWNDSCLDRGLLASLRDGELTAEETAQATAHLALCTECADTGREVNDGVYDLLSKLEVPNDEVPETSIAFARMQARLDGEGQHAEALPVLTVARRRKFSLQKTQRRSAWVMAAVAAMLIAVLVLPGARAIADQFLSLFRIQQFQTVTVDPQNLNGNLYQEFANFGDTKIQYSEETYPSNLTRAQAQKYIPFPLLLPDRLPSGVGHVMHFTVIGGDQGTFVFSVAKTRAYLKQIGQGDVAVPAQLDGAVFNITAANGVIVSYGQSCATSQSGDSQQASLSKLQSGQCSGGTPFYVAQIPSPTLKASGKTSLKDLLDFVLSLPNLSSDTRNLLQHVDLNSGSVPLPIPSQVNAQQVTVQGASGVQLTDSALKLGAVIWQTHGIMYMIASKTDNSTQLLDAAASMS